MALDLVIRGGSVVTATDVTQCDVGVKDGPLMHHGGDYTPYEGMQVTGYPVATWLCGMLLFDGKTVIGTPGFGRHLARAPYGAIKPNGTFPTPFNPVDRTVAQ